MVDWGSKKIIHYPSDKDFPEHGGSNNINQAKDNKLSLVFNIPHLSKEWYKNNTIPLDWIDITVYKPGLFK